MSSDIVPKHHFVYDGGRENIPFMDHFQAADMMKLLQLPRGTLRFYSDKNILKSDRKENNYRSFDLDSIADAIVAIILRKVGISIADIQTFSVEGDFEKILPLVNQSSENLRGKIEELRRQLGFAEVLLAYLEVLSEKAGTVTVQDSPRWYVFKNIQDYSGMMQMYMQLINGADEIPYSLYLADRKAFGEGKVHYSGTMLALRHEPKQSDREEFAYYEIPSVKCAHYLYTGPIEELTQAYEALEAWLAAESYEVAGDIMEQYLFSTQKQCAYEIWVPVKK